MINDKNGEDVAIKGNSSTDIERQQLQQDEERCEDCVKCCGGVFGICVCIVVLVVIGLSIGGLFTTYPHIQSSRVAPFAAYFGVLIFSVCFGIGWCCMSFDD